MTGRWNLHDKTCEWGVYERAAPGKNGPNCASHAAGRSTAMREQQVFSKSWIQLATAPLNCDWTGCPLRIRTCVRHCPKIAVPGPIEKNSVHSQNRDLLPQIVAKSFLVIADKESLLFVTKSSRVFRLPDQGRISGRSRIKRLPTAFHRDCQSNWLISTVPYGKRLSLQASPKHHL